MEPGSVLICDDWGSYGPALAELTARGLHYTAKTTTLSKTTTKAHLIHPHVHRVASLLKRWLLGTHQGAVTDAHLDAYLDEFVFRFNRRNSRNRGLVVIDICTCYRGCGLAWSRLSKTSLGAEDRSGLCPRSSEGCPQCLG